MADTDITPVDQIDADGNTSDDAKLLLSLEEMIRNNRSIVEKLKKELGEHRDMLKDTFEGDATFKEHQDEVKAATKTRNATKAQIMKRPEVATLAEKVKSMQSQVREYTDALSDYLREYHRVSGLTTFQGEDGEVLEIIYVAKLRPVEKAKRR
ncbi:MAG: hypothetical protein NUV69_01835 [Candidatus Curtissbacteria bacterium]|nr:hypothetical protein [Candidatus Curtissbacteria bacterium]